jgi:hypothetical protein
MTQTSPDRSPAESFPRRDANGRVRSLAELIVAAALGTVVALAALAAIEGVLALIGLSDFGSASGWLALILPALLYFDDLRAWRGYGSRFLVALVGLAVALGAGLLAAGAVRALPAILSGAVGALVAASIYAPVWFLGVRLVTGADDRARNERGGGDTG